ncbi:MAG: carbohydrate kinase family protein [Fimbriimonadaceae bacterium]|nr:carbohydrate kinase family protein [Fimbriimonadaceae bacterium]
MARCGIATAGNWIVDRVKIIDQWPQEETLARIESEQRGTGGGAFNCLVDLANLGAAFPLTGLGCVGDDADGRWIRETLRQHQLPTDGIVTVAAPTSYTDVMTVGATGRRTFFHCSGAGTLFGPAEVPIDRLSARVVHLAYLLVLARLDAPDPHYGSVGARLLADLRAAGMQTCLDVITEDSPRVAQIVVPALPHVDCLVCNELEAGVISGLPTRRQSLGAGANTDLPQPQVVSRLDGEAVRAAARRLLELGVQDRVVIHMPEGGYALCRDGREAFCASLELPQALIAGAAGAGDAFAAGVLYGLHEGWELGPALELAVATAGASLRHPTCTQGVEPLAATLAFAAQFDRRPPAVQL